jgi:DNA-binding response OmpR family regulator
MWVLIADDDRRLGPLLVRGLTGERIGADLVASGHEAIARATQTDYTAIVTELDLPDLDDVRVCHAIRQKKVDAPILILSSRIDRPFGRKSLQTVRGVGYRLCGDVCGDE